MTKIANRRTTRVLPAKARIALLGGLAAIILTGMAACAPYPDQYYGQGYGQGSGQWHEQPRQQSWQQDPWRDQRRYDGYDRRSNAYYGGSRVIYQQPNVYQ